MSELSKFAAMDETPAEAARRRQREDRIAGVMLGMAAGDALGVPYETGRKVPDTGPVMSGGGYGFAPGEWSDDTQQAICVLKGKAEPEAVARELVAWYRSGPADVGPTSGAALLAMSRARTASALLTAAQKTARGYRAEGDISNGSLMRTAPVALFSLGDRDKIAERARAISDLTHYDLYAGDAAALWSLAIDAAVTSGGQGLGVRHLLESGLGFLPEGRRNFWANIIRRATASDPHDAAGTPPRSNLNVVKAFEAALWAVARAESLPDGLVRAVRIGGDTDTVAAIAGGLLGAIYGASAVPAEWRDALHGWPGEMVARDLQRMALDAAGVSSPKIGSASLQAAEGDYGSSGQYGELGTDDPEEYEQP